jgi:hypothetical protein
VLHAPNSFEKKMELIVGEKIGIKNRKSNLSFKQGLLEHVSRLWNKEANSECLEKVKY